MQLISSSASPYVRKARICIQELGLEARVELIDPGPVTPVGNNDQLNAANPLGMIPVLITDDGTTLMDSPVICEYLNHVGKGSLVPEAPEQRFRALQLQALADGVLDLAVGLRYETTVRPTQFQWPEWIERQHEKITRTIQYLNKRCASFEPQPTIGEIAIACALGYLDFRFAERDWRTGNDALADWFANISGRPSFAQTAPV